MSPAITPQEFVAKWKQSTLRERASAQEHFIDLCRLIGHATPAEADSHGTWFTFEAGASKATGGEGWADVWKRDCFAWEYKGKHANLDKAYGQLLLYSGALANPPLLIVSDMATIRIHTHFTNTVKVTHILALDDLLLPEKLDLLRQAFNDPGQLRSPITTTHVTRQAAEKFAAIAQILRRFGNNPPQVAHFLIRLLFCLFAEDVGILPDRLFSRLVTRPKQNAATFAEQLRQLFAVMATGGYFGVETILHVDGGLFNDDATLLMDSQSLAVLAEVSGLDWAAIEPAIFGTLFQRGLDPSERVQLGAHFTSEEDILLVVEPVLMAPLRRRWADVKEQARVLAGKRDVAKGKARAKLEAELFALLRNFRAELAAIQVLDAACGSGNFLYVSLRLLLDLEKEVIALAAALGDSLAFPMVSPAQLHGIEINPYAYELAQVTIWIGYIQWWRDNGFGLPEEPILKPLEAIRLMDAIMAYDAEGKPIEPGWPEAYAIIGNPPFLGDKKMRAELGDKYVEDLRTLYAGRVPGGADLVSYWFEKARAQIAAGKANRVGLLATNSIRGGANRAVLERIKQTGDIFWAMSDRDWLLEGAAVNVSMVGFDAGIEKLRELDGEDVGAINSDLTAISDLTRAERLAENLNISFVGPSPHGAFDIPSPIAQEMIRAIGNPNHRSNTEVVRPVISATDLVQQPRQMWTIDFGLMPEDEAAQYEMPFEYARKYVCPIRSRNRRAAYADKWWQYAEARPGMREALKTVSRYIATPRVAKHRVFVWVASEVLSNDGTIVFARIDDYFFGVLHSRVHEVWALRQGTSLEDRPRYTPTTCFETFPFPWPPGQEPAGDPRVEAIAEAARALVAQRDAWLNPAGASEAELKKRTLTNLYNARPTWLDLAHRKLDAAVLNAYGWAHDLSDEEILTRLLALNFERARAAAGK
jgi:hypothetical protein